MKKTIRTLLTVTMLCLSLAAVVELTTGCTTALSRAQKTEYALSQLADGGMKSWAVYYKQATNNPAQFGLTLAQIEDQHKQVNALAKKVGAGLATVRSLEKAYSTNSATQPALTAAINAVASDAPQLLSLIGTFTGNTNLIQLAK